MGFANLKCLFADAVRRGGYVPAFNICNMETIQAALAASRSAAQPVILAFGERYLQHVSLRAVAAMAAALSRDHPMPVALHLDHCRSLSCIRQALEAGFSSVMYDGSALPFAQNAAQTVLARELADRFGATLEGELGGLNDEFGGNEASPLFTDPAQAERFVRDTGVDCLAVSVGNAHGVYKGTPHIDLERLNAIAKAAQVPLVLHGSSGIPLETLKQAGRAGVAKINVNTEVSMAACAAFKRAAQTDARMEGPLLAAREAMTAAMRAFYV